MSDAANLTAGDYLVRAIVTTRHARAIAEHDGDGALVARLDAALGLLQGSPPSRTDATTSASDAAREAMVHRNRTAHLIKEPK